MMGEALKTVVTAQEAHTFGTGINSLPRRLMKIHRILQRGARLKQQALPFHIPLDCEPL